MSRGFGSAAVLFVFLSAFGYADDLLPPFVNGGHCSFNFETCLQPWIRAFVACEFNWVANHTQAFNSKTNQILKTKPN